MNLILASGSPRRRELLSGLDIPFTVFSADFDERSISLEDPAAGVRALAAGKARAAQALLRERRPAEFSAEEPVFLGADTVVAYNGKVLGKPGSEDDAFRMLKMLSGQTHTVFTGVSLVCGTEETSFVSRTDVEFYSLTDAEIRAYIATGEPMDKAGAYGIQGKGAVLVRRICGDYFTVVGLPLAETYRKLKEYGMNPISI